MSSLRQEIAEEMAESLLPAEHEGSLAASSSQQQDDTQRQGTTLSTENREREQQEGETATGEWKTHLILYSPSRT